jgi:THAP4-like, heme-binding beta-barrel domain
MSKPLLGLLIGGLLGALDGLSAWFSPEARPMMMAIVTGSTLKGALTGLLAGFIARWRRSTPLGIMAGLAIGLALSAGVAVAQGDHYLEIVLPGMLVGALAGFATQRYPQHTGGRSVAVVILVALGASLSPMLVTATRQTSAPEDTLASLAPLVGRWTGATEGQPGKGTVEREYERILNSRFIQVRNRSTYPPQEKNKKGETHEDVGLFSFDSGRKRIVLRQFHTEGFVNQYVLDPTSAPGRLVLVTESIENIPAGWRARETYILTDSDQLEEIFELAAPGKDFEPYSRSRLTRAR